MFLTNDANITKSRQATLRATLANNQQQLLENITYLQDHWAHIGPHLVPSNWNLTSLINWGGGNKEGRADIIERRHGAE